LTTKWGICAGLLLISAHAMAGMFTLDGSTFEECMESQRFQYCVISIGIQLSVK
jgi:hypothetical protein